MTATAPVPEGAIGAETGADAAVAGAARPVLKVRDLVKHFPVHKGELIRRSVGDIHAVCCLSFYLFQG